MTPTSASAASAQNASNVNAAPATPPDGPAPAEAMFLRVFLLMRAYHVVSGLLTLVFDRHRFVRPRRAWLVFGGLVAESGWLARTARRHGDYSHSPTAAIDAGCVAIGLALCSSALPAEEQFNASNWMFPVGLLSGVGAAAAMTRRRDGMVAGAALVGSYVMATGARS